MSGASTIQPGEETQRFTLWAIGLLGLPLSESDGVFRLKLPEGENNPFDSSPQVRFTFDSAIADPSQPQMAHPPPELVTAGGKLVRWLLAQLKDRQQGAGKGALHACPRQQPTSVHQIADRLFAAYRVEGGAMHLGGCTLEDRPFVRLTYCGPAGHGGESLRQIYFEPEGPPASEATVEKLHLRDLLPLEEPPRRISSDEILWMVHASARAAARESGQQANGADSADPLATIIWCKYAEGKLRFTIAEEVQELVFHDWAETLQPPPFVCPFSGVEGYHLAATDDGRMTLVDQLGTCEQSGRRVLRSELVQCGVSGRRVVAELTAICPITGQSVLRSLLVACQACQQLVSPQAIQQGLCQACRHLVHVTKVDPRMARVLAEYPSLDRWRRWKMAETSQAYVTANVGLWRTLLLVFDKETLTPLYLARRHRLSSQWMPIDPAIYDDLLRLPT